MHAGKRKRYREQDYCAVSAGNGTGAPESPRLTGVDCADSFHMQGKFPHYRLDENIRANR
jgi:hypothetical protein